MDLLPTVGMLRKQLEGMSDDEVIIYDTWYKTDIIQQEYLPDPRWEGKTSKEISEDCDQFIVWLMDDQPYPSHPTELHEAYRLWSSL